MYKIGELLYAYGYDSGRPFIGTYAGFGGRRNLKIPRIKILFRVDVDDLYGYAAQEGDTIFISKSCIERLSPLQKVL